MTTLAQVQLKCPCCSGRFDAYILGSTNILGRYTDFRLITGGTPFIFYIIQSCPSCGFTWDSDDFEEVNLPDVLKDKIKRSISPKLEREPLTPQRKHAIHAQIYELMEASPLHIAGAYLHASWCCVYNDSVDEEREYRKKAIEHLQSALLAKEVVQEDERARLTYLIGELYRRIDDINHAHIWFDKVKRATVDSKARSWLLNLAEQQKNAPIDELTDDIFENKQLNALYEKTRDFFKNSQKLKEFARAYYKQINYKALINRRRQVILFLLRKDNRFLIGFEKSCFEEGVNYEDFLKALNTIEDKNITIKDHKGRIIITVSDDTLIDVLDQLLNMIQSQLLEGLEAFPD